MSWVIFAQILVLMFVAYVLLYVLAHSYIEKKNELESKRIDWIKDMIK